MMGALSRDEDFEYIIAPQGKRYSFFFSRPKVEIFIVMSIE